MLSPELIFLLHQQRHQEMVQQAEYARTERLVTSPLFEKALYVSYGFLCVGQSHVLFPLKPLPPAFFMTLSLLPGKPLWLTYGRKRAISTVHAENSTSLHTGCTSSHANNRTNCMCDQMDMTGTCTAALTDCTSRTSGTPRFYQAHIAIHRFAPFQTYERRPTRLAFHR